MVLSPSYFPRLKKEITGVTTNQLLGLGSSQPKSREGSLFMI